MEHVLHGGVDALMGRGTFGDVWSGQLQSIVKHRILEIGKRV